MSQKFFNKPQYRKYVRPMCNSRIFHKVDTVEHIEEETKIKDTAETTIVETEKVKREKQTKKTADKNNEDIDSDMETNKLEQLESIMGIETPQTSGKRRVKVEKKEKGLIERQEKEVVLITEDNKMILND